MRGVITRADDGVIDSAVRRLPEEYQRVDGARLANDLRRRRDRLGQAADRFYRHLSEEVRVSATDGLDVAAATALPDGKEEHTSFYEVKQWGTFALVDTGRVWYGGEESDRWHTGVGGGLWFAYVKRGNAVTLAAARSGEGTSFYLGMGFPF